MPESTGHIPPQNIEAEESVLGAMLVAESTLTRVIDEVKLNAEDFYLDKHAAIFRCVHDLYATSTPIDELSVTEALVQRNQIDEAGGKHYVSELAAKVPAAGNAKHYAEIVQQNSRLRRLLAVGQEIQGWVHERNGQAPMEMYAKAVGRLEALCPANSSGLPLRSLNVAEMVATDPQPIPWVIDGVAVRGCLTLLSGKEGEGKSLIAMALSGGVAAGDVVAGIACRKTKVLIVDAENGGREIHRRVRALGLPANGVAIAEAEGFHLRHDLDKLAGLIEQKGSGLVILDSFRSLWPGGDENDPAAVAEVLDPLRNLLRELGVAGVLLHHVSRAGNDYRGSSAIGASIEIGVRLSRDAGNREPDRRRRRLHCFKSRPAPEPPDRHVELRVDGQHVSIQSTETISVPKKKSPPSTSSNRAAMAAQLVAAAVEPTPWPELARAIGRPPQDGTARRVRDELLAEKRLVQEDAKRLVVPDRVAPLDAALGSDSQHECQSANAQEVPPAVALPSAPSRPIGQGDVDDNGVCDHVPPARVSGESATGTP